MTASLLIARALAGLPDPGAGHVGGVRPQQRIQVAPQRRVLGAGGDVAPVGDSVSALWAWGVRMAGHCGGSVSGRACPNVPQGEAGKPW